MSCYSYGRILKRVSTALSRDEQVAVKRIFSWLICARQPLRTVELEHALLIQYVDKCLQHSRALYKDVLELCGPIVEERGGYITFIHFSAREYSHLNIYRVFMYNTDPTFSRYLTKNSADGSYGIRKAQSHAEVAMACLSYLNFRYFDSDITDNKVDGFIIKGEYVLHQYSQSNFLHHIRGAWSDANKIPNIRASTEEFLRARWNPSFRHADSEISSSN